VQFQLGEKTLTSPVDCSSVEMATVDHDNALPVPIPEEVMEVIQSMKEDGFISQKLKDSIPDWVIPNPIEEKIAEEKALQEKKSRDEEKARIEEERRKNNLRKKIEAEKREAEEKAEAERRRIAAEKRALEERIEQERLAAEKAEQERIAAEKRALEERIEQARLAAERAEQERIAAEKAEHERIAAEAKAAAEKQVAEERAALEKALAAQQEKIAAEANAAAQKKEMEELAARAALNAAVPPRSNRPLPQTPQPAQQDPSTLVSQPKPQLGAYPPDVTGLSQNEQRYFKALKWVICGRLRDSLGTFQRLAEDEYVPGCIMLSVHLIGGFDAPTCSPRPRGFLSKASDKFHLFRSFLDSQPQTTEILYLRGCCYKWGFGVPQDTEESAIHFQCAADAGHPLAQVKIGEYYYDKQDYKRYFDYYTLAANQDCAHAQLFVAECYRTGTGTPYDVEMLIHFFVMFARQGAETEIGHEEKQTLMLRVLEGAVYSGNPMKHLGCGLCYEYGLGTPKDESRAFDKYQVAAIEGSAEGQYRLGLCYEKGIGTTPNQNEANGCFRKAAAQGNLDAKEKLK